MRMTSVRKVIGAFPGLDTPGRPKDTVQTEGRRVSLGLFLCFVYFLVLFCLFGTSRGLSFLMEVLVS